MTKRELKSLIKEAYTELNEGNETKEESIKFIEKNMGWVYRPKFNDFIANIKKTINDKVIKSEDYILKYDFDNKIASLYRQLPQQTIFSKVKVSSVFDLKKIVEEHI